ncbi:MAG: flagellin [Defluviitaleaceae bacterium]|nr:flagellin [Defluviitaleaceae bacterium]MCL2273790.1 flagellin [Defluviitaleaceae bacterium]
MIISHNIPALQTHLSMRRSDRSLATAMQRLSTGFRINSAKDDAAGLAIANKLSFQLGGQQRASENSTHGISLIQTAEGALNEVHAMLQRMRELAVQAANDTNTAEDRSQITREINQLVDEIHDIANRTEFNRMRILNGEGDRVVETTVDHGTGAVPARGVASLLFISEHVRPGSLPLTVLEVGKPAFISFPTPADWTASADGSFMLNNNPFEFNQGDNVLAVLKKAMEFAGIEMFECESTGTTHMMTRMAGRDQVVDLRGPIYDILGIELSYSRPGSDAIVTGLGGTAAAPETLQLLDVNDNPIPGTTLSTVINGNQITVRGTGGEEVRFNLQVRIDPGDPTTPPFLTFGDMAGGATPIDDPFTGVDLNFNFREFGPLRLQTGPSHNNAIDIHIPRLNAESLGLIEYVGGERRSLVLYTTRDGAQQAIRVMDNAIETVSGVRARLGAFQNRLESTVDSLNVAAENTERSRSRIRDTDMARESTRFAQYNVMFQAAQAMLGQANQRPQQLLSLLQ